jgi:transposase InsO family protein
MKSAAPPGPLFNIVRDIPHRQGAWRNMQDLELATLGRVDWFNNRRRLGPIGNIPPAEAEENLHAQRDVFDMVA